MNRFNRINSLANPFWKSESTEFLTKLTGHSSINSYITCLIELPEFEELRSFSNEAVKNRLYELLKIETDEKHEHPYDISISAYLCHLYRLEEFRLVKIYVDDVLKVKNLFWAKKMATLIKKVIS